MWRRSLTTSIVEEDVDCCFKVFLSFKFNASIFELR